MVRPNFAMRDVREALLPIAVIFLASRIVLLVIGSIAASQLAPASQPLDTSWLSLLCRFDCGWYMSLIQHGYSTAELPEQPGATNFSFYPLLPWAVRAIAPIFGGNSYVAAVTFANTCFFIGLIYVYRYARALDYGRTTGLIAVAMLCALPQSIVFSAVYTESLFLMLLAMAMFFLREERFLAAGVAAALLSAARANGILFIIFAVVWIIRNYGLRAFVAPWRTPEIFVPIVLAPLGVFVFWAFCYAVSGDAFAHPSTELYGWGWRFAAPWDNLPMMLHTKGRIAIAAILSIAVFLSSLVLLRQRRYEEFVLCAALILLMWCSEGNVSLFRYCLVLFPIWIGISKYLASRPLTLAMGFAAIATLNGLLMCAWTLGNSIAL